MVSNYKINQKKYNNLVWSLKSGKKLVESTKMAPDDKLCRHTQTKNRNSFNHFLVVSKIFQNIEGKETDKPL